ncbi:MAG: hypothetical protein ACJAZ8_000221 [Planctomycetota bacterium]|jgi:hypothetical protein
MHNPAVSAKLYWLAKWKSTVPSTLKSEGM